GARAGAAREGQLRPLDDARGRQRDPLLRRRRARSAARAAAPLRRCEGPAARDQPLRADARRRLPRQDRPFVTRHRRGGWAVKLVRDTGLLAWRRTQQLLRNPVWLFVSV